VTSDSGLERDLAGSVRALLADAFLAVVINDGIDSWFVHRKTGQGWHPPPNEPREPPPGGSAAGDGESAQTELFTLAD